MRGEYSRAAPSVEAHQGRIMQHGYPNGTEKRTKSFPLSLHQGVSSPNTGKNSGGKQIKKN